MKLIIILLITLLVVIAAFIFIIKPIRERSPWNIKFEISDGIPSIYISNNTPMVPATKIIFSNEKINRDLSENIAFEKHNINKIPFGEITFTDVTLFPGRITLKLFNHEIDILPRALIIDKKEYKWGERLIIDL